MVHPLLSRCNAQFHRQIRLIYMINHRDEAWLDDRHMMVCLRVENISFPAQSLVTPINRRDQPATRERTWKKQAPPTPVGSLSPIGLVCTRWSGIQALASGNGQLRLGLAYTSAGV